MQPGPCVINRFTTFTSMSEHPGCFNSPLPPPITPSDGEFWIQGPGHWPACYSSIKRHYSLPTRGNLHFFYVDKHVSTMFPLTMRPRGRLAEATLSLFHGEADINSRGTKTTVLNQVEKRQDTSRRQRKEAPLKDELLYSTTQKAYHQTKLLPLLSTNLFKGSVFNHWVRG